jgi:uncharacterized protein YbaA (DUF1428 family)
MSKYVDGFVLPIPKKNVKAYIKVATICSKVWLDHGAIEYVECLADDVKPGKLTSYPQSVKLKKNEVVVISSITYNSRKHRDLVLKRVFTDPRMQPMMNDSSIIFDLKRMIYGGFKTIVKASKK